MRVSDLFKKFADYASKKGDTDLSDFINDKIAEVEGVSVDIGLSESDRKDVVDGLNQILADTFTLYLKTHKFHWNVTGAMFDTLHKLFSEQYNELWEAVDVLAERIRALGFKVPATLTNFGELTTVSEKDDEPSSQEMVESLAIDHQNIIVTLREFLPTAEGMDDQATFDLITQRLRSHEKTAWMLRSLLE